MQLRYVNDLTYALNESGQLVNINDVATGKSDGCFCPACKEPLIVTKGSDHFVHQSGKECDYAIEVMLLFLAKEEICKAFLSQPEFWIGFEYKSFCPREEKCKFLRYSECCETKKQRFNLKLFYDSCEEGMPYDDINRRTYLKIFSSTNPERKPIYLEFFAPHSSDSQKQQEDIKIIKIGIRSWLNIQRFTERGIIEEKNVLDIYFYGFRRKDYNNNHISNEITFFRYILYKSGKTQYLKESCDCHKLTKSKASSLLEICFHTDVLSDLYKRAKYISFQKYKISDCILCKDFDNNYRRKEKICPLYKTSQIPKGALFDTAHAKSCPHYTIDQESMQSILRTGLKKIFHDVFTNDNL